MNKAWVAAFTHMLYTGIIVKAMYKKECIPATNSKNKATICMRDCFLPSNTHNQNAADKVCKS